MPRCRSSARVSANSAGGSCHFGGHQMNSSSASISTPAAGMVGVADSVPDVDPGRIALGHPQLLSERYLTARRGQRSLLPASVVITRPTTIRFERGLKLVKASFIRVRAWLPKMFCRSSRNALLGLVDTCEHFSELRSKDRIARCDPFCSIPAVVFCPV